MTLRLVEPMSGACFRLARIRAVTLHLFLERRSALRLIADLHIQFKRET
jgi:hypothetical protein